MDLQSGSLSTAWRKAIRNAGFSLTGATWGPRGEGAYVRLADGQTLNVDRAGLVEPTRPGQSGLGRYNHGPVELVITDTSTGRTVYSDSEAR